MPHLHDTLLRHVEALGFDVWMDRQDRVYRHRAGRAEVRRHRPRRRRARRARKLAGMVGIILDDG